MKLSWNGVRNHGSICKCKRIRFISVYLFSWVGNSNKKTFSSTIHLFNFEIVRFGMYGLASDSRCGTFVTSEISSNIQIKTVSYHLYISCDNPKQIESKLYSLIWQFWSTDALFSKITERAESSYIWSPLFFCWRYVLYMLVIFSDKPVNLHLSRDFEI